MISTIFKYIPEFCIFYLIIKLLKLRVLHKVHRVDLSLNHSILNTRRAKCKTTKIITKI